MVSWRFCGGHSPTTGIQCGWPLFRCPDCNNVGCLKQENACTNAYYGNGTMQCKRCGSFKPPVRVGSVAFK